MTQTKEVLNRLYLPSDSSAQKQARFLFLDEENIEIAGPSMVYAGSFRVELLQPHQYLLCSKKIE